jgi:hypothetical protein
MEISQTEAQRLNLPQFSALRNISKSGNSSTITVGMPRSHVFVKQLDSIQK